MALLVPASRKQSGQQNVSGRPSATWGTTLTGSATPHALPASPTEVIAATTHEWEWIRLSFHGMAVATTITDALCNVYIGGAGSEVLLIDSLPCGWSSTAALGGIPTAYWFPLRIPRGARLSASLRNLIASDTCYIIIEGGVSNGEHWVGSGVETLGENTAASRGTSVTPGSTSDGAWASIGTTGRKYRYVNIGVMGNNDTSIVAEFMGWDIGSGSALLQNMELFMTSDNATEYQSPWTPRGFWCDIQSGTALQVRAQSHTTASGVQYATLHGVY